MKHRRRKRPECIKLREWIAICLIIRLYHASFALCLQHSRLQENDHQYKIKTVFDRV